MSAKQEFVAALTSLAAKNLSYDDQEASNTHWKKRMFHNDMMHRAKDIIDDDVKHYPEKATKDTPSRVHAFKAHHGFKYYMEHFHAKNEHDVAYHKIVNGFRG